MPAPDEGPRYGPILYENWLAMQRRKTPIGGVSEHALYSDVWLRGSWSAAKCPYELLAVQSRSGGKWWAPSAVLRYSFWGVPWSLPDFTGDTPTVDPEFYHSGGLVDEFAALISLALGIRMYAGGETREFRPDGDPKGVPVAGSEPPRVPKSSRSGSVLPRAKGAKDIPRLPLVCALPRLDPVDANVLVLAARLYQNALWISDADPQQAWLLLISAVETAASRWSSSELSPAERLRTSRPNLEAILLVAGGTELVDTVAREIAAYMGATAKFRDFLLTFLPAPPHKRCDDKHRIPWEHRYFKRAFERIYGYRSRTLHGGAAFPPLLCEVPDDLEERPTSAIGSGRRIWRPSDVPMLLHVFEYIARGALLAWWEMLIPPAAHA